jgi:hypothetical protein
MLLSESHLGQDLLGWQVGGSGTGGRASLGTGIELGLGGVEGCPNWQSPSFFNFPLIYLHLFLSHDELKIFSS